jgi:hypothetical protein
MANIITFRPILGFLDNQHFDKQPLLSRFSSIDTIERINQLNLQYFIFDICWKIAFGHNINGLPVPYDLLMRTPAITMDVVKRLENDYYDTDKNEIDPLEMRIDLITDFVERYCLRSKAIEEYYKNSKDYPLN